VTDLMEVWSLEEGDQIMIAGNVYKIMDIEDAGCDYALNCVDEEGFHHTVTAEGSKKFRLVLDMALVSE
jgi:hypothetical protein